MLGIGGGGDIVGALALGRHCESLGTPFVLGGMSWERSVVDGHPGPWPLSEVRDAKPLAPAIALAGPLTSTPTGVRFSEARMAGFLGADTLLVDATRGPAEIAGGIAEAARELGCDLAIYVDVGGDVLARGDEPGLGSPLCDALMLAAAARACEELAGIGCVFGPGCDGELSVTEVLDRIAALARAGAWLGTWGLTRAITDELEAAAREVPTEASLQAVRCARGEQGIAEIRGGRRRVELGPLGALSFLFDPVLAVREEAPLAAAVAGAADLAQAHAALARRGVRTELDFEQDASRPG